MIGVEGAAGGLAFMASGKVISRRLFYASAAVALSLGVRGSPITLPAVSPVFHKVGMANMLAASEWCEEPPESEVNTLQRGDPARCGPTSLLEKCTASCFGMLGKGWPHSNSGCAVEKMKDLKEFCPLAEERADAEAAEMITQTCVVGQRAEARTECSSVFLRTNEYTLSEVNTSQKECSGQRR